MFNDDNIKSYIEINLKDRELISKTSYVEWNGELYKNKSCSYYKGLSSEYDLISGILDICECDNSGGYRKITYTLSEFNGDEVKLSEEQYIDNTGKFNYLTLEE